MSAPCSIVSSTVCGCPAVVPGCRTQLLGFDSDAVCKTRTEQESCANLPAASNQLWGVFDECLKSKSRRYLMVWFFFFLVGNNISKILIYLYKLWCYLSKMNLTGSWSIRDNQIGCFPGNQNHTENRFPDKLSEESKGSQFEEQDSTRAAEHG